MTRAGPPEFPFPQYHCLFQRGICDLTDHTRITSSFLSELLGKTALFVEFVKLGGQASGTGESQNETARDEQRRERGKQP